MERKPRQGWTYFVCDECGFEWKQKSRDCYSGSGEHCLDSHCWGFAEPVDARVDSTIPVDRLGNLL